MTFQGTDWKIHAHRCILFVRCPALDLFIDKEGKEATESQKEEIQTFSTSHKLVQIPIKHEASMMMFLDYIYTGANVMQNI